VGNLVPEKPGQPVVVDGNLYLGNLVKASKAEAPPIVSLTRGVNPRATFLTGSSGFVFTDVVPGTYALILDGIVQSYAVQYPGGGFFTVTVQAGNITNLGDVPVH
jgi:hypothetical protein